MTGITGIGEAIVLALIVWIGLVFSTSFMGDTFEKRPFGLTLLNNLNHGVTFTLMAVAISAIG